MLVLKIQKEAGFYISHSDTAELGLVYDRNGDVLFDSDASPNKYGNNYFIDVGNLIGDSKGIFLMKGSIEKAAEKLGVNKVTIYSYLDEVRGKRG